VVLYQKYYHINIIIIYVYIIILITSLESADKVAASDKWYTSSRSLLLPNRSLSSQYSRTPYEPREHLQGRLESTYKVAASEKSYSSSSRSLLFPNRSLSRSLLTPLDIPQAFDDVDGHDQRLLWQY